METTTDYTLFIALFGIAILATVALVGYLLWRFHVRRVAAVIVGSDGRFEVICRAPSTRKYTLHLRYRVSYRGRRSHYGLVWTLEGVIDGEVVLEEVVAVGHDTDHVEGVPARRSGTEYFASQSRDGNHYVRGATVLLAELPRARKGAEIVVTGKVVPAPDTKVHELEVFVA